MTQSIKDQAFQILDDFISEKNRTNGTGFYRDKNGDAGPEDVVFTDDTLDDMAISLNFVVDDNDPQHKGIIFFYNKKFRNLAKQLRVRLLAGVSLVCSLEDWS